MTNTFLMLGGAHFIANDIIGNENNIYTSFIYTNFILINPNFILSSFIYCKDLANITLPPHLQHQPQQAHLQHQPQQAHLQDQPQQPHQPLHHGKQICLHSTQTNKVYLPGQRGGKN